MTIALTAFREKILRKELYIVSAVAAAILVIFGTGTSSITVNGEPVTGFGTLAPILVTVVNAFTCLFALITSIGTVPAEYGRGTSHLIWIRGVPQWRFHGELALANVMSGVCCETILFCTLAVFTAAGGGDVLRLIPAFGIVAVNVVAVSAAATALSLILPKPFAGAAAAFYVGAGIFRELLLTVKDVLGGFGGELIKYALKLIPDLNSVQAQAGKLLTAKPADIHEIFGVLLAAYAFTLVILFYKKKEA